MTRYQLPNAYIRGDPWGMCHGQSTELRLFLTGVSPWTLKYHDGQQEKEITTDVSPITITATKPERKFFF